MKHVNLNERDNSIRNFVISLCVEAESSVLELDGNAIARVVPIALNGHSISNEEWNDAKNARRCALVDREFDGGLTLEEADELAGLQEEMFRFRDRVAPLPLKDARRLHQELVIKAAIMASPS
jgi:hypothetical protein